MTNINAHQFAGFYDPNIQGGADMAQPHTSQPLSMRLRAALK
ncbi:MAG: hypothetical protein AAFX54_00760 [Pseudomonadota bacterium]